MKKLTGSSAPSLTQLHPRPHYTQRGDITSSARCFPSAGRADLRWLPVCETGLHVWRGAAPSSAHMMRAPGLCSSISPAPAHSGEPPTLCGLPLAEPTKRGGAEDQSRPLIGRLWQTKASTSDTSRIDRIYVPLSQLLIFIIFSVFCILSADIQNKTAYRITCFVLFLHSKHILLSLKCVLCVR